MSNKDKEKKQERPQEKNEDTKTKSGQFYSPSQLEKDFGMGEK